MCEIWRRLQHHSTSSRTRLKIQQGIQTLKQISSVATRDFGHFRFLWPWLWPDNIYELYPYCLTVYRMCKYELPTSRLFESYCLTDRQTDIQTDRIVGNYKEITEINKTAFISKAWPPANEHLDPEMKPGQQYWPDPTRPGTNWPMTVSTRWPGWPGNVQGGSKK